MNVEEKFQQLFSSFRGVNWNNPGSWPIVVKLTIYLAAFAVVLAAAYFAFITARNDELAAAKTREADLLKSYEEKAFKAMNLDAYKKQLADMEEAFGALLRQLPKDTEVPSLLEDINHTGLGSGLTFSLIDLGTETRREFYTELPISIVVSGDYHSFGSFVSGVASLPRIVTLHDFSILPKGGSTGKKGSRATRLLELKITARTYRYSDSSGETTGKKSKKKGAAKAKKK